MKQKQLYSHNVNDSQINNFNVKTNQYIRDKYKEKIVKITKFNVSSRCNDYNIFSTQIR